MSRLGSRYTYKSSHVRVAADYSVEGNRVGHLDLRGYIDEVAEAVRDAIANPSASCLRLGSCEVGLRRIYLNGLSVPRL